MGKWNLESLKIALWKQILESKIIKMLTNIANKIFDIRANLLNEYIFVFNIWIYDIRIRDSYSDISNFGIRFEIRIRYFKFEIRIRDSYSDISNFEIRFEIRIRYLKFEIRIRYSYSCNANIIFVMKIRSNIEYLHSHIRRI